MSETTDDLSALAWVHDELRKSLDTAHKALRRYVKEAEANSGSDVDSVDPSVLRTARQQIHQGVGALELVGLPAVARLLAASEAAVQRFVAKPQKLTSAEVDTIERASFALLDYLQRLLADKPVSPLALFPQYQAVQTLAGAERVHPADLWNIDWRWRELPNDTTVKPRAPDSIARGLMERQLLLIMRGEQMPAVQRMSDICAGLGAQASDLTHSTLWKLAAAFFEGQANGLLKGDVHTKRVASRLLAQLRTLERGQPDVSERLAQDLLFFCAQSASPGDGRKTPRLAAVRQAYGLAQHLPVDYDTSRLGRFDPALIVQARKRVSTAKDAWSSVAGGEMHRMSGLAEQFSLVGDSVKRLYPSGELLADEIQQAVVQTQQSNAAPEAALAMEVATSVLYLEASLEDADFDHPEQAARVRRLAQRVASVRAGNTPDPLEAWMEELYRRVSDRQTMGSVVQELRASLSEAEKSIDQFFRNPAQRELLMPVPNQLSAMRGVLSVLGMDQASHAVLRMREDIDGMITTEVDPQLVVQSGTFDRLAGNLGALGFLIDMLSVQPQMAKSLFVFDAKSGTLSPLMGRSAAARQASNLALAHAPAPVEPRLIEQAQSLSLTAASDHVPLDEVSRDLDLLSHEAQAAAQPELVAAVEHAKDAIAHSHNTEEVAAAREQLSEALSDFVHTATDPVLDMPEAAPAKVQPALSAAPAGTATDLGDDPEMREIFLEEAREVIETAGTALKSLAHASADVEQQTTVRRAFHTLKGSSRMVGLKDFGDAAWACEQVYNTWLAGQKAADPTLLNFSNEALAYFAKWVDAIAAQNVSGFNAATVKVAAEALGRGDPVPPIKVGASSPVSLMSLSFGDAAKPAAAVPVVTAPVSKPAPLGALPPVARPMAAPPVAPVVPPAPVSAPLPLADLTFDLDLGAFDDAPAAPIVAPAGNLPSFELPDTSMLDQLGAAAPIDTVLEPMPVAETVEPQLLSAESVELIELDLGDDFFGSAPAVEAAPLVSELSPTPTVATTEAEPAPLSDDDQVKIVGPLRIGIPLFNIYLNEADELSRRLTTEVAEWAMELHRPVGEMPIALAHSLAGSSATVGFSELSHLSRLLEHALMRSQAIGVGTTDEGRLFVDSAEEVRRLLHQFAAGFLKPAAPELLERLAEHEISSARRLEAANAAADVVSPSTDDIPAPHPEAGFDEIDVSFDDLEPLEAAPEIVLSEPMLLAPELPAVAEVLDPEALSAAAEGSFGTNDTNFAGLGLPELKAFSPLAAEPHRSTPVRVDVDDEGDDDDDDIDAIDAVDAELFPIFEEEGEELIPELATKLREWSHRPTDNSAAAACMRTLHTLKGGARLAGAMRLGEMAHRLETRIEHLLQQATPATTQDVEALQGRADGLAHTFEVLRSRDAQAYAEAVVAPIAPPPAPVRPPVSAPVAPPVVLAPMTVAAPALPVFTAPPVAAPVVAAPVVAPPVVAPTPVAEPLPVAEATPFIEPLAPTIPAAAPVVPAPVQAAASATPPATPPAAQVMTPARVAAQSQSPTGDIDWSRFPATAVAAAVEQSISPTHSAVRVRGPLLERLVNQAGEVSITRSRIEAEVGNIRGSLSDLTDNLERLRGQLRDIELQAETQMSSRLEQAKAQAQSFDPLEFDRFTRFQELTRMMAESVNDVATVQRTLHRTLETTEDELAAQARLTRDLQDDLLRTRMVEFESASDRLYRVVRQAAKETGKQVRLDIVGGSIEIDRGVLDRMTPAFEHLLRNCVTHGIERPEVRTGIGKEAAGSIVVSLHQEGNEVGVEFRDDGAGLNLMRIRDKGEAMGLIKPGESHSDAELANLIFTPGFSTADQVTELAGRGVGMDVVRSEVNAMGGRIETATSVGQGTSFKLLLPLTTAVTQVVMLRCGNTVVAVPATLIEIVRRAKVEELEHAYASGTFTVGDRSLLFFWLGALLQQTAITQEVTRMRPVVVVRSAQQRIALHVDEVLGNQEVVVKNLGPQLSRLPGLAGMTLLASGAVALIYNPVALATLYGDAARAATLAARQAPTQAQMMEAAAAEAPQRLAPLVLVVDDSLTVRRVTQRLLVREGYRVQLAKDGIDALERLAEDLPQVVLSDIEMPRMDGFDLVRNIRGDARLRDLPVIMITSRIAQKHRDYAAELGVDHYLGKPYSEEDLLALIGRYTADVTLA
ncbi:Hpt domain-containing protein [Rhizobacter sp. OV335]|uniref:hybrid sensor histidine kinase/response regulator n=1 Tax=Rhizobacter sp. OV335 TaxID=1500264 RepID=UPI00090F7C2F|nr:Hpt domain-containing protein [Rhizobacter sp. OV335]SHM25503.1 chemosensory pili system protein ChpA (sensor histidine kinase/response regulator) [Rhizobacter sp. OV335]